MKTIDGLTRLLGDTLDVLGESLLRGNVQIGTPADNANLVVYGTITGTVSGPGVFTTLFSSGQYTNTVATGTPPFVISSTTQVLNLNASQLIGATWESPLSIGSATPASVDSTTLSSSGQYTNTVATGTPPLVISSTTQVLNLNTSQLIGATWAAPLAIGSSTPASVDSTTLSSSGQYTNTVATGTAPLVISSTTQVLNLNAAFLLGATWSAPPPIGSITPAPITVTTLTTTTSAEIGTNLHVIGDLHVSGAYNGDSFTSITPSFTQPLAQTLNNTAGFEVNIPTYTASNPGDDLSTLDISTFIIRGEPILVGFTGAPADTYALQAEGGVLIHGRLVVVTSKDVLLSATSGVTLRAAANQITVTSLGISVIAVTSVTVSAITGVTVSGLLGTTIGGGIGPLSAVTTILGTVVNIASVAVGISGLGLCSITNSTFLLDTTGVATLRAAGLLSLTALAALTISGVGVCTITGGATLDLASTLNATLSSLTSTSVYIRTLMTNTELVMDVSGVTLNSGYVTASGATAGAVPLNLLGRSDVNIVAGTGDILISHTAVAPFGNLNATIISANFVIDSGFTVTGPLGAATFQVGDGTDDVPATFYGALTINGVLVINSTDSQVIDVSTSNIAAFADYMNGSSSTFTSRLGATTAPNSHLQLQWNDTTKKGVVNVGASSLELQNASITAATSTFAVTSTAAQVINVSTTHAAAIADYFNGAGNIFTYRVGATSTANAHIALQWNDATKSGVLTAGATVLKLENTVITVQGGSSFDVTTAAFNSGTLLSPTVLTSYGQVSLLAPGGGSTLTVGDVTNAMPSTFFGDLTINGSLFVTSTLSQVIDVTTTHVAAVADYFNGAGNTFTSRIGATSTANAHLALQWNDATKSGVLTAGATVLKLENTVITVQGGSSFDVTTAAFNSGTLLSPTVLTSYGQVSLLAPGGGSTLTVGDVTNAMPSTFFGDLTINGSLFVTGTVPLTGTELIITSTLSQVIDVTTTHVSAVSDYFNGAGNTFTSRIGASSAANSHLGFQWNDATKVGVVAGGTAQLQFTNTTVTMVGGDFVIPAATGRLHSSSTTQIQALFDGNNANAVIDILNSAGKANNVRIGAVGAPNANLVLRWDDTLKVGSIRADAQLPGILITSTHIEIEQHLLITSTLSQVIHATTTHVAALADYFNGAGNTFTSRIGASSAANSHLGLQWNDTTKIGIVAGGTAQLQFTNTTVTMVGGDFVIPAATGRLHSSSTTQVQAVFDGNNANAVIDILNSAGKANNIRLGAAGAPNENLVLRWDDTLKVGSIRADAQLPGVLITSTHIEIEQRFLPPADIDLKPNTNTFVDGVGAQFILGFNAVQTAANSPLQVYRNRGGVKRILDVGQIGTEDFSDVIGDQRGIGKSTGFIGEFFGTINAGTNGSMYFNNGTAVLTAVFVSYGAITLNKGHYLVGINSNIVGGPGVIDGEIYVGGTLVGGTPRSWNLVAVANSAAGMGPYPTLIVANTTVVDFRYRNLAVGGTLYFNSWAIRIG